MASPRSREQNFYQSIFNDKKPKVAFKKPAHSPLITQRLKQMNRNHNLPVREILKNQNPKLEPILDLVFQKELIKAGFESNQSNKHNNYNPNVADKINQAFSYNSHEYRSPNKVKSLKEKNVAIEQVIKRNRDLGRLNQTAQNWNKPLT